MELFIGGFVLAKIPGQTEIGSGSGNFTFSNVTVAPFLEEAVTEGLILALPEISKLMVCI